MGVEEKEWRREKQSIPEFQDLSLIPWAIYSIVGVICVVAIGLDFLSPSIDRDQYAWGNEQFLEELFI